MKLRLYMKVPSTEVLGPGKRFAIWVQGCNRHCKGCIAPDTWDINGGTAITVDELANEIINTSNIEGITISGGEPFLQQEPLCEMLHKVRNHKDVGVIIYTGYNYDEISNTELARCSDIIIDGAYVNKMNDNKSLRGSSNQNIICITKRYKSEVSDYYGVSGRKMELILADGITKMIGIPSKEFGQMIGG